MFAKTSLWLMDDLVGDSRWRFHCGLSWAAAEEAERRDKWKALPPLFDGEPRSDDLLGQPSNYLKMAQRENCGGRVKILKDNV